MKLLTYANAKVMKGESKGYLTAILHLAPARLSGFNVCPMASAGCAAACLNRAGRGVYQNTQNARIRKTREFFLNRATFMAQLVKDVVAVINRAERLGLRPAIRLNGTSDIRWENVPAVVDGIEFPNIMIGFPLVQFYDYTKLPNRRDLPENYALTFSRSESNDAHIGTAYAHGLNIAAVFRKRLPKQWNGLKVIDGTTHDLRFLDPQNVIVGLIAKGPARREQSGFVVDPDMIAI